MHGRVGHGLLLGGPLQLCNRPRDSCSLACTPCFRAYSCAWEPLLETPSAALELHHMHCAFSLGPAALEGRAARHRRHAERERWRRRPDRPVPTHKVSWPPHGVFDDWGVPSAGRPDRVCCVRKRFSRRPVWEVLSGGARAGGAPCEAIWHCTCDYTAPDARLKQLMAVWLLLLLLRCAPACMPCRTLVTTQST
jgi:hypothetical protein